MDCVEVVGGVVEVVDWKEVASGTGWDRYGTGSRATASSSTCLSVNLHVLSHQKGFS